MPLVHAEALAAAGLHGDARQALLAAREALLERAGRITDESLRRTFLERPGQLYCPPEALIVYLDRFRGQEALIPLIDNVNAQGCRLPWLENRRLVISLTPGSQHGGP